MIMEQADVVMVIGARLNWMLSFGRGKWNPDTKFIQLDVEPQEIDVNVPIAAPVVGDMGLALDAILAKLEGKTMTVLELYGRSDALAVIDKAIAEYGKRFGNRARYV